MIENVNMSLKKKTQGLKLLVKLELFLEGQNLIKTIHFKYIIYITWLTAFIKWLRLKNYPDKHQGE